MKAKHSQSAGMIGGSSVLVIFAVMCMTMFAMLTMSTVLAEKRLSDRAAEAVKAYYAADCEAERITAEIRKGIVPEEVRTEGDIYSFECKVSEKQSIFVELKKDGENAEIIRWQLGYTANWENDETLELLAGE